MKIWLVIILIIAVIIAAGLIRSFYELHHPEESRYRLASGKIPKGKSLRLVFLSDLHGRVYNSDLLKLIRKNNPDIILIGGDMLNSSSADKDAAGLECSVHISQIAPTYYALGNHEGLVQFLGGFGKKYDEERLGRYYSRRLEKYGESEFTRRWKTIEGTLKENNIIMLDDETAEHVQGSDINITGLTLPVVCMKKRNPEPVTAEIIEACIGKIDQNRYNIILAHSPEFFDQYALTGADLVLSGHLHGGVVRLPLLGGLISPKFRLFPEYSFGKFTKDGCTLIVTKGCGTHHVNIRIFNRPEIAVIDIEGTGSGE
mgnify:CR=1 FL=1